MSPGTSSIISTSTSVATVPSMSSEESKSLKNFDVYEDYEKDTEKSFEGTNRKKWDLHLVSAPIGFLTKCLKDIPFNSTGAYDIEIDDEDAKYVCDNKTTNTIVSKVLPFPSGSDFSTAPIKSTCSVRKCMREEKINRKNFLPRPQPRPISEGLRERFKPFGWQRPGEKSDFVELKHKKSKTSMSSTVKTTENPPKRHKKRKLNDASSLLLDDDSGITKLSADSDSETKKSNPKRRKMLNLTQESPVQKLEPFITLNSETPPKKKNKKAPSEDQKLENLGEFEDVAPEQDETHKKLKKKKSKKNKKEKKLKEKHDKKKIKKEKLISQ